MRANEDYYNEARVAITLIDRESILASDTFPTIAREYAAKEGLTLGVRYLHHKVASVLDRTTFYFHLPYGSHEWKLLAITGAGDLPAAWEKELALAVGTSTNDGYAVSAADATREASESLSVGHIQKALANMHPEARAVYEVLKNNGSASREFIMDKCNLTKDTALKRLDTLIEARLIKRDGQSKSTFYTLIQ